MVNSTGIESAADVPVTVSNLPFTATQTFLIEDYEVTLPTAPTTQATNVNFTNTTATTTTIGWTPGNGAYEAVFVSQVASGTPTLYNGNSFTPNPTFGSGSPDGTGWFCVYNSATTTNPTVNITGLTTGTTYNTMVVDYNPDQNGNPLYLTSTGTNNPATVTIQAPVPTIQANSISFTNTTTTGTTASWTQGNGTGEVVFVAQGSSPAAISLSSNTTYTANTAYGSGSPDGSGSWYCVYNSNGSTQPLNITGLTAGTAYNVMVVDYNGSPGSEQYLTTSGTGNPATITTSLPAPSIAAFSPQSGAVGTLVTITGSNLSSPTAFTIGGQPAIVISNDGSTLVAMVMPNATSGAVSLTTSGGTGQGTGNFTVTQSIPPTAQQGNKLTESGGGSSQLGAAVALSSDGNTALIGAPLDNSQNGDAVVYTRSGGTWTQSAILTGTGSSGGFFGGASEGHSVALSADGNTAFIGGNQDGSNEGAVWVFTRSGSSWTQQGSKLVGTDAGGEGGGDQMPTSHNDQQGTSVAVSADGNTLVEGGSGANSGNGAAWVFTRSAGTWTQATELSGTGGTSGSNQGRAVAISADGATILIGGSADNNDIGAVWAFTLSAGSWTQQGSKFTPSDENQSDGGSYFGTSLALSADGNTAIIGGPADASLEGASWVFTRSNGTWAQQGSKLFGSGAVGQSQQGYSVAVSADGNTLTEGALEDNNSVGATWVFTRSGSTWTQQGSKLVGAGGSGSGSQGTSVAISADGSTAMEGASVDNGGVGAAWAFTGPAGPVAPVTQATNVNFNNTTATTTTIGWTSGNGSSEAVFVLQGNSGAPVPVNNTSYTANAAFGNAASQVGTSGWYCVYNGPAAANEGASSVGVTGLNGATAYTIMVVDYNGTPGSEQYLTSTATGNPATVTTLTPNNATVGLMDNGQTAISFTVSFSNSSTSGLNVNNFTVSSSVPELNPAVTAVNYWGGQTGYQVLVSYNSNYNGTVTLTLANSSGITPAVTNLPQSYTFTATVTAPFNQASQVNFSGTTTSTTTINWASGGSSTAEAVFISQGSSGSPAPVNNTTYNANTVFGSGDQIGSTGWYCVYNGAPGSSVGVTGLSAGTTYNVMVVDYDGTAGSEQYLTSTGWEDPATVTTVATAPTTQASNVTFSGTTATNTAMNWTPGNGTNEVVFIAPTDSVSAAPTLVNNTTYNASGTYKAGGQDGSGSYYCIFNGADGSIGSAGLAVDHLTPGENYTVYVFEYAGTPGSEQYITTTASGNPATVSTLSNDATLSNITVNQGSLGQSFSPTTSSYTEELVYDGSSSFTLTPVPDNANATVSITFSNIYNTNAPVNGAVFLAYGQNTFNITVTSQDGSQTLQYSVVITATQQTPTTQASNVTSTNTSQTGATVAWTPGNGTSEAVFVSLNGSGAAPTLANNTTYSANTQFGQGSLDGTGNWYCVYNAPAGSGSSVAITGLNPSTGYSVMAVDYDGTPGSEQYLTTSATGNPALVTTAAPPAIAVNFDPPSPASTSISSVGFNIIYSGGDPATFSSDLSAVTVNTTGSVGYGRVVVTGSGYVYTASVRNFTGNGTVSVTTPAGAAKDGYGDLAPSGTSGVAYVNNAITINAVAAASPNPSTGPSVNYTVQASDIIGGLSASDLSLQTLSGTATGTIDQILNNNDGTYTVTIDNISGTGTFQLNLTGVTDITNINGASGFVSANLPVNGDIYTIASPPTQQATAVTFSNTTPFSSAISWTPGNGERETVFVSAGGSGSALPVTGTGYGANSNFGQGDQIGNSGWYCVYDAATQSSPSVTVTTLNAAAAYNVMVIDYNNDTGAPAYLTATGAGNPATVTTTVYTQASNVSFSNIEATTTDIGWTPGNAPGEKVFMAAGNPAFPALINGAVYSGNSTFGQGDQIGSSGWYCIYDSNVSSGQPFTIQGLSESTAYSVMIVDYSSNFYSPQYVPITAGGNSGTVTTASGIQASNVTFSSTTASQTTVSWTPGNGASEAVFILQGNSGSPSPVNNTTYNANANFGSGDQIGSSGWYCVYNGSGSSSVNITGLSISTSYNVMVVDYNGTPGSEQYLTSSGTGNPATLNTIEDASLSAINVSIGSLDQTFASTNMTYTETLAYDGTTPFTLTPTPTDPNSTMAITLNNNPVTGGVVLSNGQNNFIITVTSQDGTQVDTYTVTVNANYGPPATQASNVNISNTTYSGTTISWTPGSGTSEDVFVALGTVAGNPQPLANITYLGNATYHSGTQIGSSGWYCVFNGTGSSVNVTGLSQSTAYQVMVVDYNGPFAQQQYITSTAAGNPATFTTPIEPSAITAGTVSGTIIACSGSASTNFQQFTVSGTSLTGNVTVTAPTGFELSTSNTSGFGSSVTLTASSGTVSSTPIYARAAAADGAGSISGNAVLSTSGAGNINVALSGTINPPGTINPVTSQTVNAGTATSAVSFTGTGAAYYSWSNDTPSIGLVASGVGNIPSFTAVNTGSSPVTATITATPVGGYSRAYIANSASGSVSVFNTVTNALLTTITVGRTPYGVSVSPDGTKAYVTNQSDGTVSVINTASNLVVATVNLGTGTKPYGIAVSPDGSKIYVADDGSNSVSIIDAANNYAVNTIKGFTAATAIVASPDGTGAYVAAKDTVWTVSAAGSKQVLTTNANTSVAQLLITTDGRQLYESSLTSDYLYIYNTSTRVSSTVDVYYTNNGLALSPDGSTLYVGTSASSYTIYIVNTASNTVTDNLHWTSSGNNFGLSLTADGSELYSTHAGSGTIDVYNTATKTYVTIDPGAYPYSYGNFIATVVGCPGPPTTFNITVNPGPAITTNGTLTALSTTPGTASVSTSFNVSATNLQSGVLVTPPAGFEVSTDGNSFSSTVTVGAAGNLSSTPVYVRLAKADAAGTYSGNIVLSSTGVSSVNVPTASSTVISAETITFNTLSPVTYGAADFSPGATSNNSNEAITYSSDNSNVATIVNGNIHIVGAGAANITASQVGDANYTAAANVTQRLTVSQAPLTITANSQSVNYGMPIAPLSVSYIGFVNNDTYSNLNPGPTLSTTGTSTSAPGNYSITVSGAVDANYAITYQNGTLTVLLPPLTISYTSPQSYIQNATITSLNPTSTNVAAVGYSNTSAILGSGFSGPTGVAIDASGNVYVADYGNKQVKEIPAGSNTPQIIGSGFNDPYGVAADAAGDVYVTDYGASAVYKIPAGNGTPVSIGSGFSHPAGVAIDAAGDVYIADNGHNAVKKIPAGSNTPQTIGSGFNGPIGVAVDAQGNVYVGDKGNNAVKEIPAGSNTPQIIGSGFNAASGVAVDASGNAYIGDYGNNQVKMIPAGSTTPQIIGTGFSHPDGVAVDGAGNVYVADYANNAIKQIKPTGGYYIGPFLPAGLSFNSTTGVISGTPTVSSPATTYTVTAYDIIGDATAALSIAVANTTPTVSYSSPQYFIQGMAISPLAPTSSNVAAPAYSGTASTLGSGFSGPTGVALDAAGNIYVADRGNKVVKKIPAGSNTPQAISATFSSPYGVAVDAAGDIFVTDYSANALYKVPGGNGARVTIGSGFSHPTGVAIDAAGDLYVADYGNNAVKKIPAGSNTPQVIGSGFSEPAGIAADAQGNVYVGDRGNNAVKEIPAGSNTPQIIGSGFNNPFGVAVDAAGNVFVGDFNNNQVKEIPAGSNTPVVIGSGFSNPDGVAVDGAGNVYVADNANNAVKQIKPTGGYYIGPVLPAGLRFSGTTGVISGTPTTASPATNYTVTVYGGPNISTSAAINIAVISPPSVSYTGPQSYTAGIAITPLAPTSNEVAAVAYSNTTATLGSGFSGPTGVTVDAAGNIYVADRGNKMVKKIPAGSNTPQAINASFGAPYGVAVDAAGDIYVADYSANAVYKIPGGTGTRATIGSGFSHPTGVAVDAAGDVFVADNGNNAVKKIAAGSNTPVAIGSGFSQPVGVAIDAAGNVFIGDRGNNAVKEIPAGSNTPVVIGSGFNNPFGVAVDAAGNVYVGDFNNNEVKMIPAGSNTPVVIGSGFSGPDEVAVDGAGNVYVADNGNNAVKQIKPVGGFYIGPFLPAGLTFNSTTGVISGTPAAASPATNYTVSVYNIAGSAAATLSITVINSIPAVSYAGPQNYTLNTAITPLAPTSSGIAAVAYNSTTVALGSGFSGPTGVTLDAAGDVYIADRGNKVVKKIPAGSSTPQTISATFSSPYGVAVDAAGDIYVTDYSANALYKVPGGNGTRVTVGSGFKNPTGVAVDAAGDVYVADYGNNAIKEIPAGSNTPVAIGSGFNEPAGVAVDAQGNVYVGDRGNNAVKEIPAGSNTPVVIGSGFNNPFGVAVDASGNVYVGDYSNNQVKMIPAGSSAPVAIGSGFSNPDGLAVDGAGNVYVADNANNAVKQIKPVGGFYIGPFLPAGLSFNNTTGIISGTPTAASPATNYIVTAYNNIGSIAATVNIAVLSNIANLSNLILSSGPLSPVFAPGTPGYTANVPNTVSSVTVTPVTSDPTATVKVNGTTVISGTASLGQSLVAGPYTITTVVTAQTGATQTYTITVTQAGPGSAFRPVNGGFLADSASTADDGILVHEGVSPNGDGINDFLVIDGITQYPDNHLMIINRNGALIYKAKSYDNANGVFDGHSNVNGRMQQPGTYFYSLDYNVNGVSKHKTGYIVLKY